MPCRGKYTRVHMWPWTSRLQRPPLCRTGVLADRNFKIGITAAARWSQNDGKFSPDELWQGKYNVVLKRSQRITNECYMGLCSLALSRPPGPVVLSSSSSPLSPYRSFPFSFAQRAERKSRTTRRKPRRIIEPTDFYLDAATSIPGLESSPRVIETIKKSAYIAPGIAMRSAPTKGEGEEVEGEQEMNNHGPPRRSIVGDRYTVRAPTESAISLTCNDVGGRLT